MKRDYELERLFKSLAPAEQWQIIRAYQFKLWVTGRMNHIPLEALILGPLCMLALHVEYFIKTLVVFFRRGL